MRVILVEDIAQLGRMGDIVRVSDGYGRNYLIPQGLAMLATEQRSKEFEHKRAAIEHKRAKLHKEALDIVKVLDGLSVSITRSSNDDDKLHGSVTNRDIQEALQAEGHKIDRRKIVLANPIKELGIYKVDIKLASEVTTTVKVWVVNG
ncbi:MAG: 50S ribosomal protein L9 [Bradymonadales bacterium]|jgi:large subunit ribosomal protein L9